MNQKINCLFIGGLFPKETEKEIVENSIGSVQNAANAFQWNIINGFDRILPKPITILNSPFIGSFPLRYRKLFVDTYSFKHTDNAEDMNIGFCNLTGYKVISRKTSLCKAVRKWVNKTPGRKYVFAYAMTDVMVSALHIAKQTDPNTTTCLFVPDLPEYMNMSKKSSFFHFLKETDIKKQKSKFSSIDLFVYLTKQMNEKIGAPRFTVIEGIANDAFKSMTIENRFNKTVLYTGGLNEKYGVKNLVDAFMQIRDKDYKLILCGSGELVTYIQECQQYDTRIDYRGTVMHDEILSLQMRATVLVNPRQNTEEFTKYSFPSKNLEYLASGTPVIAYKLDGIPDEYDEYFVYVSDNSVECLKSKIEEICGLSDQERMAIGAKARKFVLEEKKGEKQIQKLLDMMQAL